MKGYDTVEEAMRAVLEDGNIPILTERVVKRKGLDVQALALNIGCTAVYERDRKRWSFKRGN